MKNENPEILTMQLPDQDSPKFLDALFSVRQIAAKTYNGKTLNDAGKINPNYGIEFYRHYFEGESTNVCYVVDRVRHGCFPVSKDFTPIPHPQILGVAQVEADTLGLPLLQTGTLGGHNITRNRFADRFTEEGAIISNKGNYMAVSYLIDNVKAYGINIGEVVSGYAGKSDVINAGITIINALDGTSALHVIPFTKRAICLNTIVHMKTKMAGWKGTFRGIFAEEIANKVKEAWSKSAELQKKFRMDKLSKKILNGRFVHRGVLNEEALGLAMATQLEFAREYLNVYAELAQIKLNMAKAQQVVDALPVSLAKQIECLEVKRHKVNDHYVNDIVITDKMATQYTLLQNVTQPLSHQVQGEYQTGTFNAYMGKNKIVNNLFFSIESRENAELIAQ